MYICQSFYRKNDIIYLLKFNNYVGNKYIKLKDAINTFLDYDIIDLYLPLATDEKLLFKRWKGTFYRRIRGSRKLKPVKPREETQLIIDSLVSETIVNKTTHTMIESDKCVVMAEEVVPEVVKNPPRTKSNVEEVLVQDNNGIIPDKDLSYVDKANITLTPYPYQTRHVKELTHIFTNIHNVAFNGSDTGTCKTCSTLELAKSIRFTIFCVSPSAVQEQWRKEIVKYEIPAYTVSTYGVLVKSRWTPIMKDGNLGSSRVFPRDDDFPRLKYSKRLYKSENKNIKKDLYEMYLKAVNELGLKLFEPYKIKCDGYYYLYVY